MRYVIQRTTVGTGTRRLRTNLHRNRWTQDRGNPQVQRFSDREQAEEILQLALLTEDVGSDRFLYEVVNEGI